MEMWYFIFEVRYYDEYDNYEPAHDEGIICAPDRATVMERLERWYGSDNIYEIRIRDVEMDTNEILFERNFPGLVDMLKNPIE